MLVEVDIFAWIPHPDVPNPIAALPGGIGRWGPGACGPRFGGDDFIIPAITPVGPSGMITRSFRARQNVTFLAAPWGSVAGFRTSGVIPGITTVLTATRAAGGKICHRLTATVVHSAASARFDAGSAWYEVVMEGKAQDPIPGAVGAYAIGTRTGAAAAAVTPALAWDLRLRLSSGSTLGFWTAASYRADAPFSLDQSGSCPGTSPSFGGGTGSLLHGLVTVRRYPSYAVYVTMTSSAGVRRSEIVFFADASSRNLLEIAVAQDSELRRVTF